MIWSHHGLRRACSAKPFKFKFNYTTMLTDQNHEEAPGFCAPSMPLCNRTYLQIWKYHKRWHQQYNPKKNVVLDIFFTILESKWTKKTCNGNGSTLQWKANFVSMNPTIKSLPNHATTSTTSTAITILNKYHTTWTPWENVSRKSKKLWWWNHGTWWRRILGSWVSSFSWSKLLQLFQTLFFTF